MHGSGCTTGIERPCGGTSPGTGSAFVRIGPPGTGSAFAPRPGGGQKLIITPAVQLAPYSGYHAKR